MAFKPVDELNREEDEYGPIPEYLYIAATDQLGSVRKIATRDAEILGSTFNGIEGMSVQLLVRLADGTYIVMDEQALRTARNKSKGIFIHSGDVITAQLASEWLLRNGKELPFELINAVPNAGAERDQPVTSEAGADPSGEIADSRQGGARQPQTRQRSTPKGKSRDKIIAALTAHHKYEDGSCLNTEPIGNNELAEKAGVPKSTASEFFNRAFAESGCKNGFARYQAICRDVHRLVVSIKMLRGELMPCALFGSQPPAASGQCGDEE